MAAEAEKRGLPAQLPVMAALVESNLTNVNFGDADSLGYFQMRVSIWDKASTPASPTTPSKQVDWFLDTAERVKEQRLSRGQSITDPNQFGEWIADVERPAEQYRGRYQLQLDEANGLLANAPRHPPRPKPTRRRRAAAARRAPTPVVDAGAVGPGAGVEARSVPRRCASPRPSAGFARSGANTGPQVDRYLEAAGVAPGNPWCASFLTWSLEQAGHKMPGGGWAGVATWVRNAEQGSNGLKLVSAEEARPGDIAAYDWGGGNDFGADGHIGFLDSSVKDGQFTALEGNNADAVNVVPRQLGGANIVFIRVEGDAPAGAARRRSCAGRRCRGRAGARAGGGAGPAAAEAGRSAVGAVRRRPSRARPGRRRRRAKPARLEAVPQAVAGRAAAPPQRPRPAPPQRPPRRRSAGVPGAYPGDDAPKEQIAAWMAKRGREARAARPTAGDGRTGRVRPDNVNYGDADSVGYFQMRVWDLGPAAPTPASPTTPRKQINWFLDNAERVKDPTPRPRPIDHRPQPVRRMDRRRRTPRRAIPRPLPTPTRRGQRTPRQRPQDTRRRPRSHRPPPSRRRAGGADRSGAVRPGRDGRHARRRGAGAAARTRTSCSTTSASPTSRPGRIDPRDRRRC